MKNREMLIASIQLNDIPMIHELYGELKEYCPCNKSHDCDIDDCTICEAEWLDLEHEKEG